jgi:FMN phosphatase YigB (HAD superfamily)/DNA-binding XRE family transcriptional regulator
MNEGGSEVALGHAIQNARKSAGLTQQELCERLDISYSTLTKIERGAIKAPSIFTVIDIAKACGVSIEQLIGVEPLGTHTPTQTPQKLYKKALNGIEFVYFDINGCMVRFFQRAFSQLAEETGVRPEVIEDTFWHYNDAVCRGEMSLSDFNQVLGERVGKKNLDWTEYYLANIDPIDEMRECITWASEHYKVGLLSNIMPGFINKMIERQILPDLVYNCIVDSSVVGAIKPENRIYEYAAERSGVGNEDILLVDDSRTNLMAAEKLGWHVLWFDDFRPGESVQRVRSSLEF